MKKLLGKLLAFVMVLSITSIAFAGPFTDVPAQHWAYDAISQLAKTGIVDGYDDATFRGGKTMTRYEMAMIVGKAMERSDKADANNKALIEKLAVEFAAELNKLGVRVSKLEEKTKLNILVETRLQMNSASVNSTAVGAGIGLSAAGNGMGTVNTGTLSEKTQFSERIRIYLNGPIGDKWQFNARYYQQKYNFGADNSAALAGNTNGTFDRFYVTGNDILGGTVEAGKGWTAPGKGTFWMTLGDTDGISYTYKTADLKVRALTAKYDWSLNSGKATELNFIEASYKPSKNSDIGGYWLTNDWQSGTKDIDLISINGAIGFDNGQALSFEWAKNRAPMWNNKSGYVIAYQSHYRNTWRMPTGYDGAVNPFKQGDSAWAISYRHLPAGVAGTINRGACNIAPMSSTTNGYYINTFNDVNAWRVDYYTVPWKNVVWAIVLEKDKDIQGRWTNNVIQTAFVFIFK